MPAVLFGLVLAGGASTRMKRDKAALAYHGKPQVQWAYDLLSEFCAATFVSVRPDQRDEPTRATLPQIVDRLTPQGEAPSCVAGSGVRFAIHHRTDLAEPHRTTRSATRRDGVSQ